VAGLHVSFVFLWCLEAVNKQQVLFKTQEGNFINTQNVGTVLEIKLLLHMCVLERFKWFIEGLDDLEDDRESVQL
jgi:hypothetical protein